MRIDWGGLGFHYTETDYIVRSAYHGEWQKPYATRDKIIPLHVCATCLQYGQEAFEGLKVFRGVDGKIRVFRWQENAKRMADSARGLKMEPVPESIFEQAMCLAIEKNKDFIPPYESGATLYLRPLLIGTTPRLGVGAGSDYEFIIIPSPIGPYYKDAQCTVHDARLPLHNFLVTRHVDRAAPLGTGQFKVGGNYAASFRATEAAHAMGLDCLFLDAKTHHYIDECSAANFIGIREVGTKDKGQRMEYLTPRSTAILPSITNDSLMTLAREMGLKVTRRKIRLEELSELQEAAACGTACVISPIGKVIDPDKGTTYTIQDGAFAPQDSILSQLYHRLQDIQYGRSEDRYGWCTMTNL